jgi:cysteine synthase A
MQGWTPDFIPKITGDIDRKAIHKIVPVSGPDALRCSQELAAREGIFVGITSGAAFAVALEIARDAPKGANILCMLPDTGERYLSTPLFANVPVEMTDEEVSIFRSTPFGLAA